MLRKGRWLQTKEEAQEAAVKARLASWSDFADRQGQRKWFAGPMVSIEERTPVRNKKAGSVGDATGTLVGRGKTATMS